MLYTLPAAPRSHAALLAELRKWGLWACCLGVAVWAGVTLSLDTYQRLITVVLIAAAGLTVVSVQLTNGLLGLSVLIFTAVAFPMEFAEGPSRAPLNSSLPLAVFIVLVWLLDIVMFRRHARTRCPRAVFALVALMVVGVLSFAISQFGWATLSEAPIEAQLAGLAMLLASVGLSLVVAHQVSNITDLARLTWVFIGAGTITCVTQTVPGLGIVGQWVAPDSVGSLFWTWMVAMCFSQAACNRGLSPLARFFLFCMTALALYRGLFEARSWVSGWLPPLVACGAVLLFRLPRATFSLVSLGGPIVLIAGSQFFHSVERAEQYSTMTRLEAWKVLWSIVQRSILLGLGPSNYYYQTLDIPILGWYVSFSSHNQYVDLVAQFGILGLIAFCWFVFEILRVALRLRARIRDAFAHSYLTGALAGLVGTLAAGMLADWIVPFYYNIGIQGFRSSLLFWFFVGAIIALHRIFSEDAEAGVEAAT